MAARFALALSGVSSEVRRARASRFSLILPIGGREGVLRRMRTCAYCGRPLRWFHRVVGGFRYCSKEHAQLHQEMLGSALLGQVAGQTPAAASRGEAAAPSGEDASAAPLPPDREQDPFSLLPLLLPALSGENVALPPLPAGAVSPPGACPELELPAAVDPFLSTDTAADLEAGSAAPPACLVPVTAGPVPAMRLTPQNPAFLRPRRRIIVPAHRAPLHAALRPSGPALPRAWTAPLGGPWAAAGTGGFLYPGPCRPSSPDGLEAPASSLVMSFESPGSRGPGLPPPASPSARARRSVLVPRIVWETSPLFDEKTSPALARVQTAGLRPQVRLRALPARQQLSAGLAPESLRPPASPPWRLLDEQAAVIHPFRLHRMPLRPLRVRPSRLFRGGPSAAPAPLARCAFAALHVPRVRAMPVRPAYRILPLPAGGAPGVQKQDGARQSASPAAADRIGG